MAWAPGKGVKGKEFKEYWEVDLGVSYVPYDRIREDAEFLDLLEEGGFIDEDSLPEHLKGTLFMNVLTYQKVINIKVRQR